MQAKLEAKTDIIIDRRVFVSAEVSRLGAF